MSENKLDVLVSVVIPTHNRANLIERAIKSALNQSYKNLEVIVVSDGSTDNTSEIVENIKITDDRVRFVEYFPGKNGNYARNRGIQEAKGEYVAFLDDDDEWLPLKIQKQLVAFENQDVGMVYTGVHIIYVKEKIEYSNLGGISGDLSKKILLGNFIGTTSTVMIKKSLLTECEGFDDQLKAVQDFDLWIRICQKCNVGYIKEELINYYNYPSTNQVSSNTGKYIEAYGQIESKYKELYQALSENEIKTKNVSILIGIANRCLRNGESKEARVYFRKALRIRISFKTLLQYCLSFLGFNILLKIRKYMS